MNPSELLLDDSIRSLDFKHPKDESCPPPTESPRSVVSFVFPTSDNLCTFDITESTLKDTTWSDLEDKLINSDRFTTLKIANVPIGPEARVALLHGLESNTSLQTLRFCECEIDDSFCLDLINVLPDSIVHLDLGRNEITDVGAGAVAKTCTHMKSINLALNNITEKTLLIFADQLHTFDQLVELDLYHAEATLPMDALCKVIDEVDRSQQIVSLCFGADIESRSILGHSNEHSGCQQRKTPADHLRLQLRLNKLGRASMLQERLTDRDEVINKIIIIDIEEGLSGNFALLRDQPNLLLSLLQ